MTTTAKVPRKSAMPSGPKRPRSSASFEPGTALVQRTSAPIEGLVIGGEPRVHLLPPHVLVHRRGKIVRRRLGFGVVAVVVLVAAGYGAVNLSLANSQSNLLAAQSETSSILQQQTKYGDVLKVKADASAIQSSQKLATAQEILWAPFVASFESTVPSGATITALTVALDNPFGGVAPGAPVAGPLQGVHVATITGTLDMPQSSISGWLNSLTTLKGFVDVTPSSVSASSAGMYSVSITMHVSKDDLSNRFAKTTGDSK